MPDLSIPKAQLLIKTQNIKISNFKNFRQKYPEVKIPKSAKTYSITSLIDNQGNYFDIITFTRKKLGDIARRYFISKGTFGTGIEKEDFIPQEQELVHSLFNSKSRIIKRETFLNGQLIRKSEETQAVTQIPNGSVVHIKEVRSKKFNKDYYAEAQKLYSYQKGQYRKGYEIAPYLRTKDYYLAPENFRYHFEGFNVEQIKNMISDKYLPLHLYSIKDFKSMAPSVAMHPEHKINIPCKVQWRKDMQDYELGDMNANLLTNKKTILINENLNKGRNTIISTAAHENEHAYECEQAYNLMIQDMATEEYVFEQTAENYDRMQELKKRYPVDNIKKASLYKYEYQKYIKHEIDQNAYHAQIPEIRARVASVLAEEEYQKSSDRLKSEFPYAPDSFLGTTEAEKIDYDFTRNFAQETTDMETVRKMEDNYTK